MAACVCLEACFAAPRYQGPKSDHFDGRIFHNLTGVHEGSLRDALRWQRTRQQGAWSGFHDLKPGPKPQWRVGPGELKVTWVNHATSLIQMDGLNVLTDPIWSERASPVGFAGPARMHPPGIRFEDLPPIDVVLISHNHYDHLDVATLQRLEAAFHPRFLAGLGNQGFLRDQGLGRVEEKEWWAVTDLAPGMRVTTVPAQHFSNRGLSDRDATLWVGYVLEGRSGRVYFAGDTGFGPHFQQIRDRLGPVRLAVLPIGAFKPEWFMHPIHMGPEEAVRAARILEAGTALAIHYRTFDLADDGETEPVERLAAALKATGMAPDRFWTLEPGEGRSPP